MELSKYHCMIGKSEVLRSAIWGEGGGRPGKDSEKGLCLLMEIRCGAHLHRSTRLLRSLHWRPCPAWDVRSPSEIGTLLALWVSLYFSGLPPLTGSRAERTLWANLRTTSNPNLPEKISLTS